MQCKVGNIRAFQKVLPPTQDPLFPNSVAERNSFAPCYNALKLVCHRFIGSSKIRQRVSFLRTTKLKLSIIAEEKLTWTRQSRTIYLNSPLSEGTVVGVGWKKSRWLCRWIKQLKIEEFESRQPKPCLSWPRQSNLFTQMKGAEVWLQALLNRLENKYWWKGYKIMFAR